ncbi:hypothetical protein [Streptomyces lycii]|uniref:Cip1-like core domain-containing protein n=1 Tax=Streptomyces lycii TaxID=2654337 RepID=A0ABQ7FL47_9ACTN|nr:hypothetical protein [Streptomyces lycii]KAF4409130.1 hypothetical protein GCU69_10615 [Streptomyces lycii]
MRPYPLRKAPLLTAVAALLTAAAATAPASAAPGEPGHRHGHGHGHGHGQPHHPHPQAYDCTDASLLFCEDFSLLEPGDAHSPEWSADTENGTLTVEEGADTGKHLRIRTEGNGKAFLTVTDLAPPGNSFWGRVRLRVDAFPTAPDWAHWTLVEATGEGPGYIRPLGGQFVPTAGDGGTNLWGVGADGGPTGDWTSWQETVPAEAGVWSCVEWEMDDSDNRISVWIDGEAKPELTVDTDDHGGADTDFLFPEFDTVKIGWQLYQGDPTPSSYDVLMDDIALSADRVGCDDRGSAGGRPRN